MRKSIHQPLSALSSAKDGPRLAQEQPPLNAAATGHTAGVIATVTGRVAWDPEIRGSVANVLQADTDVADRLTLTLPADFAADALVLRAGDTVTAIGDLRHRTYELPSGEHRSVPELEALTLAPGPA